MRMRLRAPDLESSHEENEDDGNGSEQCTTESCHQLPLLDVGSPEYIEERLENLKRRPKWRDFLDQYVQDHPESDSESETSDLDEVLVQDAPGFVRWTLWSLLVVALAPLLVLCAPFLRHQGYGFWPLGCRSMKELFGCAVAHVISMVGGLGLLYWTICRELPDVFHVGNTLVKLNAQIDEMLHTVETCHLALLQWERAVAQELCMPVAIDAALLLVNVYLLLHCHCRRARYLMALMVVIFVADVPTKLYDLTFPAPEIHEVDPNYAMVDEELLVALDGKNLKQGGSVAWVAYWGCAVTSNVDACETQFVSTFEAGNVAVTFKSIDYFIPCYRDPPNPLKAQEYKCFEHVRIRVKDKRSIPGWSRSATRSLIISQPAEAVTLRSIERLDGFKMITFKSEKGLLSSTVSQDVVEAPSSKRSIVALMESSASIEIPVPPEYGVTDNDEPFGLDTEGVRLSSEGDTQELK
uniref:Transmembrane protein n=1 Tax=Peronospora matthiolae TaxID=2874970 RepID=A0AAV1V1I0_9STRA